MNGDFNAEREEIVAVNGAKRAEYKLNLLSIMGFSFAMFQAFFTLIFSQNLIGSVISAICVLFFAALTTSIIGLVQSVMKRRSGCMGLAIAGIAVATVSLIVLFCISVG